MLSTLEAAAIVAGVGAFVLTNLARVPKICKGRFICFVAIALVIAIEPLCLSVAATDPLAGQANLIGGWTEILASGMVGYAVMRYLKKTKKKTKYRWS
jgi:hypothetical protein